MFNQFNTENGTVSISDIQFDHALECECVIVSLELDDLGGWILSKKFPVEILNTINQLWCDEFDRSSTDLLLK